MIQRGWFGDVMDRGLFDGSMLAQADPGLPRSFIKHYMEATGAQYNLTHAEMIEVDAEINVFSFGVIHAARNRLIAQAQADPAADSDYKEFTEQISGARGHGGANKNQTLGNFTVTLNGTLTVTKGKTGILAEFQGTATYYDYWDFDPKVSQTLAGTSGRTGAGEVKTIVGSFMEGKPFPIDSADAVTRQPAPVRQQGPHQLTVRGPAGPSWQSR